MPPRPPSWSASRNFGIVIDAGSSGSRIQVYSWLDPEIARQLKKSARESVEVLSKVEKGVEKGDGWHYKIEPGISTFGSNPTGVGAYLKPLMEMAVSVIPPAAQPHTPIYLLATAGMRLLPPDQQDAVLLTTCAYLRTFPFLLPDCSENVRIISGEEEGLYGWIAVNYLMDGFDSHTHGEEHDASTYGFLDMGGASTQIAFEPTETERIKHADNLLEVRLRLLSGRDVVHPVFVTTWLGFGTNQARDRYIAQEVRKHHVEGVESELIDDPCLPKSLLLTDERHSGVTLRGTGDFMQCVRRTGPLLNKEVKCLDQPCLFNGVHVPRIDFEVNHFIGISEYWYSTHDLWAMGGMYDFVTFEKNSVEFCSREWEDIMSDHKAGKKWRSDVEVMRLETQCFKAAWVINVLHEGIGIPRLHLDEGGKGDGEDQTKKGVEMALEKGLAKKKPPRFQSVNTVGDVAVSWTLGKMVLEVSRSGPTDKFTVSPPSDWSRWADKLPSIPYSSEQLPSSAAPLSVFALIAFAIYFCLVSPSAARRRHAVFGLSKRRTTSVDFTALSMEDQGNGNGSDSSISSSSSGPRGTRGSRGGLFSPLRRGAHFLSSVLRSWSGATPSSPTLPTSAPSWISESVASSSARPPPMLNPSNDTEIYRPRPLRQQKSVPFLRNTIPSSASNPALSTTHWNDAPDLTRSLSSSLLATLEQTSTSTASQQYSNVVSSGTTTSRPTTPGVRGGPALTKLSRTRDMSSDEAGGRKGDVPGTPPSGMWGED